LSDVCPANTGLDLNAVPSPHRTHVLAGGRRYGLHATSIDHPFGGRPDSPIASEWGHGARIYLTEVLYLLIG